MAMWQKMGMHKYREIRLRFSGQAPIKERIGRFEYWKGKVDATQRERVKELRDEISAFIGRTDDLWSTPSGQKLPLPEKIKIITPTLQTASRWAIMDFLDLKINEDFAVTLKKMQKLGLNTKTSSRLFYCLGSEWYNESELVSKSTVLGMFSEKMFEGMKADAKKREGVYIEILDSPAADLNSVDMLRNEYFWRYTKQMATIRELVHYEEDANRRVGHFDITWFESNQGVTMYRLEYWLNCRIDR